MLRRIKSSSRTLSFNTARLYVSSFLFKATRFIGYSQKVNSLDSIIMNSSRSRMTDTTRSPRLGEVIGLEHNFATKEDFLQLVEERGFIEHAQFGGNYYGTSVKAVKVVAEKGRNCVLYIEMEVGSLY